MLEFRLPERLATVPPGQTATISVTITSNAPKGTMVGGTLFNDAAATEPSANELVGLPTGARRLTTAHRHVAGPSH